MKCNQSRPGFELESSSSCPLPTMITITPRAPPPFSFISGNLWMGRVWKSWRWLRCTHTQYLQWNFSDFLFCSARIEIFWVYLIFMQILGDTPPTYILHMDMPPSCILPTQFTWHCCHGITCVLFTLWDWCTSCYATHATDAAFTLRNNLCPVYFRKQVYFSYATYATYAASQRDLAVHIQRILFKYPFFSVGLFMIKVSSKPLSLWKYAGSTASFDSLSSISIGKLSRGHLGSIQSS